MKVVDKASIGRHARWTTLRSGSGAEATRRGAPAVPFPSSGSASRDTPSTPHTLHTSPPHPGCATPSSSGSSHLPVGVQTPFRHRVRPGRTSSTPPPQEMFSRRWYASASVPHGSTAPLLPHPLAPLPATQARFYAAETSRPRASRAADPLPRPQVEHSSPLPPCHAPRLTPFLTATQARERPHLRLRPSSCATRARRRRSRRRPRTSRRVGGAGGDDRAWRPRWCASRRAASGRPLGAGRALVRDDDGRGRVHKEQKELR